MSPSLQHPILFSIFFLSLSLFSARAPLDSPTSLVLVSPRFVIVFPSLRECERTSSPLLSTSRFVLFECFCYCYFFCLPPNRPIPVLDLFSGCWWLESLESCSPSSLWSGPITDDGSANPALNLIFSLFLFLSLLSLVSPNPDTSIPSSLSFRIRLSSRLAGSRLVHLLCLPLQRLLRRILPRTTLSVTDIPILSPTNQPLHIRPLPLLPPLVWLPPRILTL